MESKSSITEILMVISVLAIVLVIGAAIGDGIARDRGESGIEELNGMVGCQYPCMCGHAHHERLPSVCAFCLEQEGRERSMTIYDLAKSIRETNEKNGFDRPTWDNLPVKLMLVVTELDEGVGAIRGYSDDPLTEELADAAIRILDVLYSVWDTSWSDRASSVAVEASHGLIFVPLEVLLWDVLRYLSQAVEFWRHENQDDSRIALEMALREVFIVAGKIGCKLDVIIEWKNAKNATRGKLHGKARSDG